MSALPCDAMQFSDTFDRYGGVEGYAQALEIGATELPLDRWVQVRTPAFKAEYGDWEFARNNRPLRKASNKGEVEVILKSLRDVQFSNKDSGLIASLSNNSVKKILSAKAFEKSLQTTDTGLIHLAAAANIDVLFTKGILGWIKPDNNQDRNILGLPRLFSPIGFEGKIYLAETTVKMFETQHGLNRIYTVEAINILDTQQIIDKFLADTKEGNTSPVTVADADLSEDTKLKPCRPLGVSRVINLAENIIAFNQKDLSQHLNPYTFEPPRDFLARNVPSPLIDLNGLGNREAARKLHDSVGGDIAHLLLVMLSAQAAGKQIDAQALIKAADLHPIARKDVWLSVVRSLPAQANHRTRHQDKDISR